jgi:hypothetical protein
MSDARSDDRIPEERQASYTHLISLLQRGRHEPEALTASEQADIIARVQDRLTRATALPPQHQGEALPVQQPSQIRFHPSILRGSTRRGQVLRFARELVAVLLVGLLVGAALLVFRSAAHQPAVPSPTVATGPTATRPTATGPTAVSHFNGLQASIQVVTPGPYFLSELVALEVGLTNHTGQPVLLAGTDKPDIACYFSALSARITAGEAPTYTLPTLSVGCLQYLPSTTLGPGQTLTFHYFLPLTKSGAVMITMGSMQGFPPPAQGTPSRYDPYVGHWPAVSIQVDPQVPATRALALRSQGAQVIVQAPPAAQTQLLYRESIDCDHYGGGGGQDWSPLPTPVLSQPACPTAHRHWAYIVSAPGYATVGGTRDS